MLPFVLLAFLAAPSAPSRWPIETLAVEGNRNYTPAQVLTVAGLKKGQMAGKDEFEAARLRLLATGMFETVGYRFAPSPGGKGYAASFQVVEVEPVYPVRFEDLGVPETVLIEWLKSRDPLFSANIPATRPVLERYAREIETRVKEKVTGRVIATGPEKFAILFRPARPLPAVAQVTFTGNQVVPAKALQDAIGGVGIGLPYTEPRFRELLDASVRPLYEARGRVRVAFPKIAVEPAKDVSGLVVTVAVEEGASYDLGQVRIEGAPGFKREELLKTGNFKTGDIANFELVQQGVDRIRNALRRSGYLNAQAAVERKIDDTRKTVDLTVRIDEGPQYTFGSLEIVGLDLHGEAAIRRMWAPKPGKPFNADYPDHFLDRVKEEGLFDNLQKTRAAVKVNEQEHTADVTLYFNK